MKSGRWRSERRGDFVEEGGEERLLDAQEEGAEGERQSS